MYLAIAVVVVLILCTLIAARSHDRAITLCAFIAWAGVLVAAGAMWVSSYRWSNQSGCPEAYPEEFGYRAPNWELLPNPVSDNQSWWPLGRACRGLDARTSQFVTIEFGWNLSVVVYTSAGCAAVAAVALVALRFSHRNRSR